MKKDIEQKRSSNRKERNDCRSQKKPKTQFPKKFNCALAHNVYMHTQVLDGSDSMRVLILLVNYINKKDRQILSNIVTKHNMDNYAHRHLSKVIF